MNYKSRAMKNKLLIISTLIICCLISSCEKDDREENDPNNPQNNTSLTQKQKMVNKNYVYIDYNYSIDGTTYSTLSDFQACQRDDITTFYDNGLYTYDDYNNRCTSSSPQVITATWALTNNDTELTLEGETPQTILINDGKTLKLHFVQMIDHDNNGSLNEHSFTTTYNAQ